MKQPLLQLYCSIKFYRSLPLQNKQLPEYLCYLCEPGVIIDTRIIEALTWDINSIEFNNVILHEAPHFLFNVVCNFLSSEDKDIILQLYNLILYFSSFYCNKIELLADIQVINKILDIAKQHNLTDYLQFISNLFLEFPEQFAKTCFLGNIIRLSHQNALNKTIVLQIAITLSYISQKIEVFNQQQLELFQSLIQFLEIRDNLEISIGSCSVVQQLYFSYNALMKSDLYIQVSFGFVQYTCRRNALVCLSTVRDLLLFGCDFDIVENEDDLIQLINKLILQNKFQQAQQQQAAKLIIGTHLMYQLLVYFDNQKIQPEAQIFNESVLQSFLVLEFENHIEQDASSEIKDLLLKLGILQAYGLVTM